MDYFNTYRPCNQLQDIVEVYWRSKYELNQSLQQEMYTPTLQALTFNLGGQPEDIFSETESIRMDKPSYIIGQPLSKRISLSNSQGIDILGVKFTTLGLYLLTGIDMWHITDNIVDASDIWNSEITLLYEELLENTTTLEQIAAIECFLIRKRKQRICDQKIHLLNNTLDLMENKKIFSLSELRENNYVTKKTFERYFLNHIGVTPKQYSNICRFNSVRSYLDTLFNEPDWQDIIVNFGYYDQSHLIREFKRFAGKTPTEYHSEILYSSERQLERSLPQMLT